jgi:hypothetical protein
VVGGTASEVAVNVVFLSPHFPLNFFNFVVRLREAGANPLAIADEPWERLRPELRAAVSEYYRVSDMHRYDEMVRGLGYLVFRHGRVDRLDSLSEHWLETEARLREDFNVPGLRPADMGRLRRKSEMKRVFASAGLTAARGRLCRDEAASRAFVAEVGYPVVAKPDAGVGAAQTFKIEDAAGLESFLSRKPPVDYFLEEFVHGRIVTYDGLADRDGRVVFDASLHYSRGIMEVVNEDADIWYYADREIAPDLERTGRRLVEAFGLRERFFHLEFFRLPDGRLLPLEVNARPPGGLTVDMWNYQNDADLYREWANLLVTGRVEGAFGRPHYVAYVGRKHRYRYALPTEEVRGRFPDLWVHDEPIVDVFSAAIGNHGFVLRGPRLQPLADAAAAIQERA